MAKLTYLGHASFKLTLGKHKVVYIDPYAGDYDEPADYVFITHEHHDHNDLSKLSFTRRARVYHTKDLIHNGNYAYISQPDFRIACVPAANANHKIEECVGLIIRVSGACLYFAGDTSKLDSMSRLKTYGIDYAFLPIDGVYNMGPEEAVEVFEMVGAKKMVPIHTDPESDFNLAKAEAVKCSAKYIMKPGDVLEL